jgi:8-oxo-dGTP diphosphatase
VKGFILLILALFLSAVLLPLGFAFQIITAIFKGIDKYLFRIAKSIDQLGNVVCEHLFNVTLIKKNGYKFGNEDVTISHVLGMNEKTNTLSFAGKLLAWLLNTIDKDHNQKAIEYDSEI